MDSQNLDIIGGKNSHDALRIVLSERAPCDILDVPAGRGVLTSFLREKGWKVHAADIDRGNFKLNDVPFTQVNLNNKLPFADASFDAVCCANGLHRLIFPEIAMREFYRILRPGGRLYVNLNNYSSIRKRIRFLVSGSIDEALDTQYCLQTTDDREANVRFPLLYSRLTMLLNEVGYERLGTHKAAVSFKDRLLFPVAVLVRLLGSLIPRGLAPSANFENGNDMAVLAGGAYYFVEARKPG